ncbi:MAG: hypothetical protein Kow00127_11790 [Bacteroidales bacterium]
MTGTKPILSIILTLLVSLLSGQVFEDFSDGELLHNPEWTGDTALFQITGSSAFPEMFRPGLQLHASEGGSAFLAANMALSDTLEWQFWCKISLNTSANNFARFWLISSQPVFDTTAVGYYVQLGGSNDSVSLVYKDQDSLTVLATLPDYTTGNTTNVVRIKAVRYPSGIWELSADPQGGQNFMLYADAVDAGVVFPGWTGPACRFTSSNITKFYWDDIYFGPVITDTVPPEPDSVTITGDQNLSVWFSEPLLAGNASLVTRYTLGPGATEPSVALPDSSGMKVMLTFPQAFSTGVSYTLHLRWLRDLSGNIMADDSLSFMIPGGTALEPGTVVLHEFMADEEPPPAGLPAVDWLELKNNTGEEIHLDGLRLRPRESSPWLPLSGMMIPADSFLVITAPADTALFGDEINIKGLSGFSLNNEGLIELRNSDGTPVHAVSYDTDWYRDDEKSKGGWSLEMTDPSQPCTGAANWWASDDPAGGTPGRSNSHQGVISSDPEIVFVQAEDEHSVVLKFNHSMDSLSVTNPANYQVDPGAFSPDQVICQPPLYEEALLIFDNGLPQDATYDLILTGSLSDCSGKMILPGSSYTFVVPVEASPWEVVFNEIMFDPSPPAGLPPYEYLELFNRTGHYMSLKNWQSLTGSTLRDIPDVIIPPGGFALIVDDEAAWMFSGFGQIVPLSSLSLPNEGGLLFLLDNTGRTMAYAEYSPAMIADPEKQEGGWSLEQIDTEQPCGLEENWTVSLDPSGGTPGKVNSVAAVIDKEPGILYLYPDTDHHILHIRFNQAMSSAGLFDPGSYRVDPGGIIPLAVTPADSSYLALNLLFEEELAPHVMYHLTVTGTLSNCAGTATLTSETAGFGIPETPEWNDLVINEVLFNPLGSGVDFIEIYNRSEKVIDLSDFKLGIPDEPAPGITDTSWYDVSANPLLMLPGEFRVFTSEPSVVMSQYFTGPRDRFVRMASFPALGNHSGSVVLADKTGSRIDQMSYDESMHHPLLLSVEGVSLERVHYDLPSGDPATWHSAAETAGFATPGLPNSQFREDASINNRHGDIEIVPEVFTPDNDGNDDVTEIRYSFDMEGAVVRVAVFSSSGRMLALPVDGRLAGTSGRFIWDGRKEDGMLAPAGIYIIWFEALFPDRTVARFRKPVTLIR